ncbi:MAG TPA: GNAT family N-acetyltransferase, partial [Variovorax sp.]|nr:GNAT family N-acetyltransferase [Variovorax sp.]
MTQQPAATTPAPRIRVLSSVDDAHVRQLADVLVDCVEGGASVSFMLPLAPERAQAFW